MIQSPEYNFVNMGQSIGAGQKIAANRMALDDQKNIMANRKKAADIRAQTEAMPEAIQKARAQGLNEQADQWEDHYRKTQLSGIKMMSELRGVINKDNYKKWRNPLVASGAVTGDMFPVDFNDSIFDEKIEEINGKLQKLSQTFQQDGKTLTRDDTYNERGDLISQGSPYEAAADRNARTNAGKAQYDVKRNKTLDAQKAKPTGSKSKAFQVKTSDSNSIRGAMSEYFGGNYNQETGKYWGVKDDKLGEFQSASELASRILAENKGAIDVNQAVSEALRQMGKPIRNISLEQMNDPDDPLGLRRTMSGQGPLRNYGN